MNSRVLTLCPFTFPTSPLPGRVSRPLKYSLFPAQLLCSALPAQCGDSSSTVCQALYISAPGFGALCAGGGGRRKPSGPFPSGWLCVAALWKELEPLCWRLDGKPSANSPLDYMRFAPLGPEFSHVCFISCRQRRGKEQSASGSSDAGPFQLLPWQRASGVRESFPLPHFLSPLFLGF